jgi:hypothetical protein
MKLKYKVVERINTYRESKKEFAIDIKLDSEWWTYVSYEGKPTEEEIQEIIGLFQRAYSILQPHIKKQIEKALDGICNGQEEVEE